MSDLEKPRIAWADISSDDDSFDPRAHLKREEEARRDLHREVIESFFEKNPISRREEPDCIVSSQFQRCQQEVPSGFRHEADSAYSSFKTEGSGFHTLGIYRNSKTRGLDKIVQGDLMFVWIVVVGNFSKGCRCGLKNRQSQFWKMDSPKKPKERCSYCWFMSVSPDGRLEKGDVHVYYPLETAGEYNMTCLGLKGDFFNLLSFVEMRKNWCSVPQIFREERTGCYFFYDLEKEEFRKMGNRGTSKAYDRKHVLKLWCLSRKLGNGCIKLGYAQMADYANIYLDQCDLNFASIWRGIGDCSVSVKSVDHSRSLKEPLAKFMQSLYMPSPETHRIMERSILIMGAEETQSSLDSPRRSQRMEVDKGLEEKSCESRTEEHSYIQ